MTSGAHEFFAPDQARDLLERVPHARWELFEDGAHAGPYEEPERYATVLRDFLVTAEKAITR